MITSKNYLAINKNYSLTIISSKTTIFWSIGLTTISTILFGREHLLQHLIKQIVIRQSPRKNEMGSKMKIKEILEGTSEDITVVLLNTICN
jgi:hypothetical protein